MKICFLTQYYPVSEHSRNLYSDLMDEIASYGHDITVFRSEESTIVGYPKISFRGKVRVISVPTGKVTKVYIVAKVINTLLTGPKYLTAIKFYYRHTIPNMVIVTTPPITFYSAASNYKKKGAFVYLLLKDIFPQNAVDLGMFGQKSLIYRFFRQKEKKLYKISDVIGCMSQGNKEYLLMHNYFLKDKTIEINPNSIKPSAFGRNNEKGKKLLKEYKIPEEKIKVIYGGNIGKPQGIEFLLNILQMAKKLGNVHFIICGSGTEYSKLEHFVKIHSGIPITLIRYLENGDYRSLLSQMDIGLVLLDKRFTIPNFPQRVLDYFDFSLPVLAATDKNTDFGRMLQRNMAGLWSESGDIEGFMKNLEYFISNPDARKKMGRNGRVLLDSEFSVKKSAQLIIEKFAKKKQQN